jgi:hypothetical protein
VRNDLWGEITRYDPEKHTTRQFDEIGNIIPMKDIQDLRACFAEERK